MTQQIRDCYQSDVNAVKALTKTKKRKREEEKRVENQALSRLLGEPPRKRPAILRRLNPVIEMQREDTFSLGLQASMKFQKQLCEENGYCVVHAEEKEEDVCGVRLKRHQYREIEDICQKKDPKIGSQLFEIYQILESRGAAKKNEGQAILEFAREIIREVPDLEAEDMEIDESEETLGKYREAVEKYLDVLPIDPTEENIDEFAIAMQKAVLHAANEDMEISDDDEVNPIDLAQQRLGYLLLAAQNDLSLCARSLYSLDGLSSRVAEILEEAAARVEDHSARHKSVAIQSSDEAMFHKMSLELAGVLLLDTGSLNFGVLEAAVEILIPDSLKETAAMDNLWIVMIEFAQNPLLWQQIAEVRPPKSKDVPSDAAIRTCFSLENDQPITRRHAQLFVLSALLGHLRQAKAGTCFATACLIKTRLYHPHMVIDDLAQLTEKGYIKRMLFKESRTFPFQARVSKEYLDLELKIDRAGRILSTKRYDLIPDRASEWPRPQRGMHLYDSPGIIAACRSMGLTDAREAVKSILDNLPEKFSVNDLLKLLAQHAYNRQESAPYLLRSQKQLTATQFLHKAQFAFGCQTNHPLHRAFEQVATTMVNYFGAQYMMPAWVFWTMKEVLEKADRGYSRAFQMKYKKLMEETFLPMITRMRYLYNHNLDKGKVLFGNGNYGIRESYFFGYQLCDSGLPKDFKYSTDLYNQYSHECSSISLERFKKFTPPTQWKLVDSEDEFRGFLKNVIAETVDYLKKISPTASERRQWAAVGCKMQQDISEPSFTKRIIFLLLGRGSDQKKEYDKNRFGIQFTPWQFRIGGDFNEVLKTYFGFGKSPAKLKKYNGTPKEVLTKCINYIKSQPLQIKETFDDSRSQIIVASPCHVFLMRPFEPTFKDAWESKVSTNDYILEHVEKPGLSIAGSRFNLRQRKEILSFVKNNMWATRYEEKDDWVRQQLTKTSKEMLDRKIAACPQLIDLSVEEFRKMLEEMVFLSRAEDVKIGERNRVWEQRFKTVLNNRIKQLIPNQTDWRRKIQRDIAMKLIDFARNRQDTIVLVPDAARRFLAYMERVPLGISITDFRKTVADAAYRARCEILCGLDPEWKGKFCEYLDTKLFSVLSEESRNRLIESGIVTHDTNWKEEIHNIHFIFLVNPGTAQIELARFNPDTKEVTFMSQDDWFPRKSGGHGYWLFPDNYRVWPGQPLFNVRKHIEAFM